MENHRTELVNLISNRTTRENNARSSSLQPQRPRESNECEIAKKQHHRKRDPSPLSSSEVSLTLSVDDIVQRIASQLDSGKTDHNTPFVDVEAQLTGDESDDLNPKLFHTKESHSKTRISKVIKQVLKICGYAVAATVAVPLIAGGGMITIVVAGVAGIVSIPVLYGINKYRKDLRLDRDPYSYSCVARSVLRLCQILATKLATARFLRKDCGLAIDVGRKLTDKEEPDGKKDWNEYSVNSNKARIHFPPEWEIYNDQVFFERETEHHIAEDVLDRNELRAIKCDIRPQVSFEREKPDEGSTDSVWHWGEKDTQGSQVFVKRKPDEGPTQNSRDCGEESVDTQEIHVQVPLEKETKETTEDNVRDWDEQILLESMHKARAQVLSEIELPASSTEVQTDDKPTTSLPLPSRDVTYHDESQDSSYKVEISDASKTDLEVFDETKEDEDLSNVEDQNSHDEMSGTASKLTDGREALSDEDNIYGRRDLQCILPKKSFSDTFCCVKVPNDGDRANRRAFVRFRGHDHYEIDTHLNWGIPKQVENKDETIETKVQGSQEDCTVQKQDMEELPDKEPKKPGKRRRKRRTNKRVATENMNSLAANDADDELDKNEQEERSLKISEKPATEQKNQQKTVQLPGENKATRGEKQPKQKVIKKNEGEAKTAVLLGGKSPRKKANLKKKDKAKKESPARNNVEAEKPKTKLFSFVTTKNTADSNDCHEQKTERKAQIVNSNSPGVTPSKTVKSEITCVTKIEEEKERDVISLYNDIDE